MAHVSPKKTYVVSLENKKTRGSGHERKNEILDAARQLFLRDGVESVSTRRIAELVGISQTALYVYFKNKDAILGAVTDVAFKKLGAALGEVERSAADPLEYLKRAIPTYMRFGLEHPDEYRLAFRLVDRTQDPAPSGGSAEGRLVFAAMEMQVVEAIKSGLIKSRRRNARGVAQSVWASIHGLVAVRLAFPDFDWVDADELIAIHSKILIDGLTSSKAPA